MSDTRLSIEDFPAWLQEQQDTVRRRCARFLFDVSGLVQKQTVRNIARTFGDNPRTPRAGSSGKATGSNRGLANSVMREFNASDGSVSVVVGGTSAPYAAIQELGGDVTPKKTWLTIPNVWDDPTLAGKRAAEFPNSQFVRLSNDLAAIIDPDSDLPFRETVLFWLKKSVHIPARPYLGPAAASVLASQEMNALAMRYFGFTVPMSSAVDTPGRSVSVRF